MATLKLEKLVYNIKMPKLVVIAMVTGYDIDHDKIV